MKRKIIKTVMTYEYLDIEELDRNQVGLEIQDFTEPNLSDLEVEEITNFYYEKLKDFKGLKAMHGPFIDLKPASPDKDISRISVDKYIKALEIAEKLDLDYIVFHSQINPNHIEEFIRLLNAKQNAEIWHKIIERSENYRGTIVLENVFEKEPEILRELLDHINLPNVRLNLDIGHANLGVDLESWVSSLKDYLVYSHIHSNNGKFDQHKPISLEKYREYMDILDKYDLNPVLSLEYKIDDLDEEMKKFR